MHQTGAQRETDKEEKKCGHGGIGNKIIFSQEDCHIEIRS